MKSPHNARISSAFVHGHSFQQRHAAIVNNSASKPAAEDAHDAHSGGQLERGCGLCQRRLVVVRVNTNHRNCIEQPHVRLEAAVLGATADQQRAASHR